MDATKSHRKLTPPQVGKLYGVDAAKVLAWIASGELRAVNVVENPRLAKRPRWRIDPVDLEAFELRRTSTPPIPRVRRRRRDGDVTQYF